MTVANLQLESDDDQTDQYEQYDRDSNSPIQGELESGFYNAYELREILGRGLASTVRKCIEKSTNQVFAVKIVDVSTERQSIQDAERLKEETLSEVRLLRLLSGHPSIIAVHDFFATPTYHFAVFEMAPRGELFDLLNRSVTLSEKKTRSYMRQLFDGVSYMHEKQIIHRDLKLENILCIDEQRIVISDFGFAKQLEPGQLLKDLFGTPGYLAPETLKCQMYEDARGYSFEADNWALGVIMYTLLAGYAPFYHRQQLRMMRLIQEGRYEFPRQQWDSVSEDAKDLIKALLTVDVTKRITAVHCLEHRWFTVGTATKEQLQEALTAKKNYRILWRNAINAARFLFRIRRVKVIKKNIDRHDIRKRPFRFSQIRHEAEAAAFAVYGHWVNRGFYYSRDMLFANKPRPKYSRATEIKAPG
jgi:phosphorylase kinase gamma subunit